MVDSLVKYWYMWLILVILIGILVWAAGKASKAVKKKNKIVKEQQESIDRYKNLIEKYKDISAEAATQADAEDLAEGITAVLQREIEKAPNMNEEFKNSPLWRQTVYALHYFSEDSVEKMSFFFKNNGEPITHLAVDGLKLINESAVYDIVVGCYSMYDDNNERVSLDTKRVDELNEKFGKIFDKKTFYKNLKNYIVENLE